MATVEPVGNGHANGACKIRNGTCSGDSSPLGVRSKQANGASPCGSGQDSPFGSVPSDGSSEDLLHMQQQEGFDAYLGSETENVADIFSRSESSDDLRPCSSDLVAKRDPSFSSSFWTTDPAGQVKLRLGESGVAAEKPRTIMELFQTTLERYGSHSALAVKRGGTWLSWTYKDYYHDCLTAAKGFIELGLELHHGVCIIGFNAPEWHMSNIAAIMAGGLSAGIFITSTAESCCYVANSCKANIVVVENETQLKKILQVRSRLHHLKAIVHYGNVNSAKKEDVYTWEELLNFGRCVSDANLHRRMENIQANQCSTVIYTSGTTGHSKGVMLSHDNITFMCQRTVDIAICLPGEEKVVSYLPLSHIAAQLLDIYVTMACGGCCWFAQPDALKGSLLRTLREVKPTLFLGVPRVWEKIAESMQLIAQQHKGIKARISRWAKGIGLRGNLNKQMGGSGTPFGWSLANVLFFKKVRRALGLDQCHFPMTGAAPISQDTLTYFMSINIPIREIYGMSETTGPTTVTSGENIRFRSSGMPIPGIDMIIHNPDEAGSGEVLVQGRHVFMGYLGEPQATQDAFKDGYLRTGDIGYVSPENYLYITGRSKDLIITTNGENIAPVPIEISLKQAIPVVSNAVVIGDQRQFLSCLLTLKVEFDDETGHPTEHLNAAALAGCKSVGSDAKTVSDILVGEGDGKVLRMIQKGVDAVNQQAPSKSHRIVKWSVLQKDFSIPTGELTHTMKIKRKYIIMKYQDAIDEFYSD